MEIPKDKILELLRERGAEDKAAKADQELPAQVDPERDRGVLEQIGIDPQDLFGQLGGIGDGSACKPGSGSRYRRGTHSSRSRAGCTPAWWRLRGDRFHPRGASDGEAGQAHSQRGNTGRDWAPR
jgi:hypothetical protein